MKTILYMATTVNGMIAKTDDNVDWISEASWKSYQDMTKSIGCSIIGRKTYDLMPPEEFLEGTTYIVLSKKKQKTKASNVVFAADPQGALQQAANRGFTTVLVAGGSKLNESFLKENLVNEVYLDVEPTILGEGIPVFASGNFEHKLQLIDHKKLAADTLQLHYAVI